MSLAVIELHDVTLRCGTSDRIVEAPGHALVTAQGIVTGAAARARAWREPQHSFDQYWQQLGTTALPVASRYARHFADLAHAQLLALHQAAGAPARVIFAVPGSFGRDQLAVLLGIAHAMPFAVAGLIDAALAATQGEITPSTNVLHIDLLRHCAVLTHLRRSGEEVTRERVVVLPELSLNRLHELWARHIAERFIASHRYDPLHTASGEQALRETLPDWLATLARQAELNAVLAGPRGPLPLVLSAAELIAAAAPLYTRLLHSAAESGDSTRLLAQGAAALPGLRERLGARALPATASIAGTLAQREAIAARPANVLITRLPIARLPITGLPIARPPTAPLPAMAPSTAPERPRATHLLWRHRAQPIGAGLALRNAAGEVQPCAIAGAPAGPWLESSDTRLSLRGADAAIELAGDAKDLRAGDQLRIGGEVLELIQVLASTEVLASTDVQAPTEVR